VVYDERLRLVPADLPAQGSKADVREVGDYVVIWVGLQNAIE
jgi:hypothetical protein